MNQDPQNNLFFDQGGQSMGEYLYSAPGTQSAAISDFFMNLLNLDPKDFDSTFLYEIYSEKWGKFFY